LARVALDARLSEEWRLISFAMWPTCLTERRAASERQQNFSILRKSEILMPEKGPPVFLD
jgi:hypothetical protein